VQRITIPTGALRQEPTTPGHKNHGKDSYICRTPEVLALLQSRYARDGLCLKVFRKLTSDEVEDPLRLFHWGGARLDRTILVQNLFATYGLAPRVYDVVILDTGELAQVVQYASGEGKPDMKAAEKLVRRFRIGIRKGDDYTEDPTDAAVRYTQFPFKWVGGLFVDFGRFFMRYPKQYRAATKKALMHRSNPKTGKPWSYQAVPELGVPGQRNIRHRLKHMRLDDLDFRGKTVLDIGCNTGEFMREALRRGAKRVVGVDYKRAHLWQRTMDLLGYYNHDIYQLQLPEESELFSVLEDSSRFDIVFCLGILQHMAGGLQQWIADLTADVLILEGDVKVPRQDYDDELDSWFAWHELTGYIRDEDKRCLFRAYKAERPRMEMIPGTVREMSIHRGYQPVGRRLLTAEELGCLYDWALAAPAGPCAEVGVAHGSSLICWAGARAGIRGWVWAVDQADSYELRENIRRSELSNKVRVITADSVKAAKGIAKDSLAFLFIDADHTERGIRRDLAAWAGKVRAGGFLAFHDFDPDESKKGKGYAVHQVVSEWARSSDWALRARVGLVAVFAREGGPLVPEPKPDLDTSGAEPEVGELKPGSDLGAGVETLKLLAREEEQE